MRLIAIIDAYVAFSVLHKDEALAARLEKCEAAAHADASNHCWGSSWDYLGQLEDDSREAYFALAARKLGAEGETIKANWERIHDVAGVTIQVTNSDDDPMRVDFVIQDEIADAWADAHGSLDGGTWECADGPDFVYDITYWHPGLFEELKKEGYDLDFSNYSEPDEDDLTVAKHIGDCDECQEHGDFHKAREHFEATRPGHQEALPGVSS